MSCPYLYTVSALIPVYVHLNVLGLESCSSRLCRFREGFKDSVSAGVCSCPRLSASLLRPVSASSFGLLLGFADPSPLLDVPLGSAPHPSRPSRPSSHLRLLLCVIHKHFVSMTTRGEEEKNGCGGGDVSGGGGRRWKDNER